MKHFETCLKLNNLGEIIDKQYGQWGKFTVEAADAILEAARLETEPYFRPTLAAMAAVTVMNEAVFNLRQVPNTNTAKRPENIHCPAAWDYGPTQINFFWSVLDAWEGNTKMKGLPWREVFGAPPYVPDAPFTGNPVTNIRAGIRIMLAKNVKLDPEGASTQESQVVLYPGGDAKRRAHRRADWVKYDSLFLNFFECYQ